MKEQNQIELAKQQQQQRENERYRSVAKFSVQSCSSLRPVDVLSHFH